MIAEPRTPGRPRAGHDRKVDQRGYVRIRTETGWEYEHRLILARVLARPLARGERVRWLNGDHSDNRPENLQLEDACPNCGASIGFSHRVRGAQGASRTQRHKPHTERLGQRRLWRGAP